MWYSNGYDSTYEELISFYPAFYRNVLEMRAILEAQGRIGDNCIDGINNVLENCFVESADEAMITRLEAFLKIETDKNLSLEERRRVVYSYFVGFGKISASKLKEIIRAFTDADSEIYFKVTDEAGNNTLMIDIMRGETAEINYPDIVEAISKRLPAHIAYRAEMTYTYPVGVARERSHYLNEYKQSGLEPEVATIGDKNQTETVSDTGSAAESYGMNYRYCGTAVAGAI